MLLTEQSSRLAIFAYYDEEGIADDYVAYLLEAMRAHCAKQIVVVNGTLTPESEAKLRPHCTKIIYRENKGFDVTAYKEGFLQIEDLEQYDEIVFYNQTIFGPVCSLTTMFHTMAQRNLDFWALTRHKGARKASWDNSISIAPHLQSYFFAVRKPMFTSKEFREYWESLPEINSYWDAVGKHEVVFTQHFDALGYQWDSYIHTEDLEARNDYPMMGMPVEVLRRGSPFFKRKSFLCGRGTYSSVPQGAAAQQLLEYIRTQTTYPVRMLAQNLLRTTDVLTLREALTLTYDVRRLPAGERTVAVLWFAKEEMAELLCIAASALQKDAALLCLFATQKLCNTYSTKLPPKAQCIITEQNGLRYLFKELWKDVAVFENIVYLHNELPLLLDEFADESTLYCAVQALTHAGCGGLLESRPEIGLLVPPRGMHQETLSLGLNWRDAQEMLSEGLAGIDAHPMLPQGGSGYAVRGSMFFARKSAVCALADFAFTDEMFEGEYPAYEFLLPLIAQSAGYFTAEACTAQMAFTLLANAQELVRQTTEKWATPRMKRSDQVLFRMQGILDFYYERRFHMTLEQAFTAKLTAKQKLWICLQIVLKPETFRKLQGWLGHKDKPVDPPVDELE